MSHEAIGKSDEWFTPKYIFDALGCTFNLDVAGDLLNRHQCVPASSSIPEGSLEHEWRGLVWMNPPFGGRNALWPWINKFIEHGNGIALVPDRTSAPWWQHLAKHSEVICFLSPKVRFIDGHGRPGKSPSNGITLHGIGEGSQYVKSCGLGVVSTPDTEL